jgi:hypothetical protein
MLSVITIKGRQIVVESDPVEMPLSTVDASGVPRGAEATNFGDRLRDGAKLIEDRIGAVADTVLEALKAVEAHESSVEIGLAFKGEHSPIPVIVKFGADASIKVKASWKKPTA